jgi:hypothetical protein
MASLSLRFTTNPEDVESPSLSGNLLRAEIFDSEDLPQEVFVFQRNPRAGFADPLIDEFWGIASVAQLETMGTDQETVESGQFYRDSVVDLIFENLEDLGVAKEQLRLEVQRLVIAKNYMDTVPGDIEEEVIS